jgi:hypothetical protein
MYRQALARTTLAALACVATRCSNPPAGPDVAPIDATDIADSLAPDATLDATDVPTLADVSPDIARLTVTTIDTHFTTAMHMLASFEMQSSGEPLAQSMGRNLGGYDRNLLPPNMYTDPTGGPDGGPAAPVTDLVGFATAIESYEYSKQPMNNLALESGAGVSLLFGPVLNPTGTGGSAALDLMRAHTLPYAIESHIGIHPTGDAGAGSPYFVVPIPTADPSNVFGWHGLWPTMFPYRSFDPTIAPHVGVTGICSITPGDGDDGRGGVRANPVGDYECDYNTLHVPRSALDATIGPGAAGWASWKYALWITNYLQIMHDLAGNAIGAVAPTDQAHVGDEANAIVGQMSAIGGDPTMMGVAGTYLGSSDIEGFQAAMMIDELDNAALAWLTQLNTTDGATLGGFASVSSALAYDYNAPLRWIPADVGVTETPDASGFPRPAYHVTTSDSRLLDLLGLAGGYAQLYGVTDEHNSSSGGAQPALVYFDGNPFPHDDQLADGEPTLHDRALALIKFVTITIDRVHRDPTSGLLVDTVTFAGGTPTRGATLSTTTAAYVMTGLRTVRRTLGSHLTLYANSTPDTAVTSTPLDSTSFAGAPAGANIAGRLTALLRAHADLLLNHLTDASGNAVAGWNVTTNMPTAATNDLDSHAAAVNGLLEAYLATGDTRYRDRAVMVFAHMESTLWDPSVRMYRSAPGASAPIEFTPLRFALVERTLREMYKLIGLQPGNDAIAAQLQSRIARLIKLVLNGWNDMNDDGVVDWPSECVRVVGGLPRGGLQMAERALTGELGMAGGMTTQDRDHDCVPDISAAMLPAALASDIVFDVQH